MRLLLSSAILLCCLSNGLAQRIVGYYTSWSIYGRQFYVTDIPPIGLTHINYAFANISNGQIVLGDPYADTEYSYPGDNWFDPLRGNFKQLIRLKTTNPTLKTLISVGGWSWSDSFSDVALTPASRELFANSCASFVMLYDFNGVDLDWEYPDGGGEPGNIERPEDPANFVLLCERLRVKLDSLETLHNREFLLTMAAGATQSHIQNLDWPALMNSLDFVNVMCYDFAGAWSAQTCFNAPLFMDPANPFVEPVHSTFNSDAAMQALIVEGVPRERLVMGVPFHGKGFANVVNLNNGLYQNFNGMTPGGTWEPGIYDFTDLRDHYVNQNGFTRFYHPLSFTPFLHNPATNVFITYEDVESISDKAEYVLNENLGGVMIWELSADRGSQLLNTVRNIFINGPATPAPQELTVQSEGDSLYFRWQSVPAATQYSLWSSDDPSANPSAYTLELSTSATSATLPVSASSTRVYFVRAQ